MDKPRTRISVEDRLWRHADKSAGPDGCWLWGSTRRAAGYGYLVIEGKKVYAHRLAYMVTFGPIPAGMNVCHSCDNPPCVNPAHLWLGTHWDNEQDKIAKGRKAMGASVTGAKLSDEDVRAIRDEYIPGRPGRSRKSDPPRVSLQQLADRYGVSKALVHHVVSGKSWTHVD